MPESAATRILTEANASALFVRAASLTASTAAMNGSTDDTAAVQAFINATPAGSTITMPPGLTLKLNDQVTINKPLTITGWKMALGASNKAFYVTSPNVTIQGCDITGAGIGGGYVLGARPIWVAGTSSAPLDNVQILNNRISGVNDICIYTSWTVNGKVNDNYCRDFIYGGIFISSGTDIDVIGNTTRDATQGSPAISYGIAVTDLDNTIAARSARVKVHYNTVANIPDWEGIDTHGGLYISIIGNTIRGARRAIQCLVGNESTRPTAPQFALVVGNTIDGANVNGASTGITLFGKTDSSMLASGVVTGNVITNCTTPTQIGFTDTAKTIVRLNSGADQETDTGWLPLTGYLTGWSSNTGYPARYRIVKTGGVTRVQLDGVLSRTAGWTANLLTLPVDARPGYDKIVGAASTVTNTPQGGTLEITAAGVLRFVYTAATTDNVSISGAYVI